MPASATGSAHVRDVVSRYEGAGMRTWALAGRPGSPLADRADESVCVDTPHTATVQEIHLIAIHLLCAAVDEALLAPPRFRQEVVA